MELFAWLKCMLRGGHNPNTLLILEAHKGWIDGIVPVAIYDCQCASCGKKVRKVTSRCGI